MSDETQPMGGKNGGPSESPESPVRSWPSTTTIRDLTSISVAVMIFVHETLLASAAQPALIAAASALLGFPLVARAESRK